MHSGPCCCCSFHCGWYLHTNSERYICCSMLWPLVALSSKLGALFLPLSFSSLQLVYVVAVSTVISMCPVFLCIIYLLILPYQPYSSCPMYLCWSLDALVVNTAAVCRSMQCPQKAPQPSRQHPHPPWQTSSPHPPILRLATEYLCNRRCR